jgi:hypothetical protein
MAVVQQGHKFLQPEMCGSSVGYYVVLSDYTNKEKTTYNLSATVALTDCNHKIDWAFEDDSLEKIDLAIDTLKEFRTKYIAMQKMYAKLSKEK